LQYETHIYHPLLYIKSLKMLPKDTTRAPSMLGKRGDATQIDALATRYRAVTP
jgi:hypothetical protein